MANLFNMTSCRFGKGKSPDFHNFLYSAFTAQNNVDKGSFYKTEFSSLYQSGISELPSLTADVIFKSPLNETELLKTSCERESLLKKAKKRISQ